MAAITKRVRAKGTRYTARVRLAGKHITKTFGTLAAAEAWARLQEGEIEAGSFAKPATGTLGDLIDDLLEHRGVIRRPFGKTAENALARLKARYENEPIANLTQAFWRSYALDRMKDDKVESQTAVADLLYASVVMKHAKRAGKNVDDTAPSAARSKLKEDGLRVSSRERSRAISDKELAALFGWIDENSGRTHVPLGDIVRFALATAMRRGEILTIAHEDLQDRVVLVRNRKHPRDQERIDEVPLLPAHEKWPRDDPIEIIKRQRTKKGRIFPYLGDTVGFWFEQACEGAGLSGVVFHQLRHESLTRYARDRKLDLLRLQLVGGHRDVRHLMRYTKLKAEDLVGEMVAEKAR